MLTKEGFKRKLYIEYVEEMEAQARELWGANVNLTDLSPLGKWIKLVALGRMEENQLAEQVYLSGHIDDSEGVSLEYNAKRIGLSRLQAVKSNGFVTVEVEEGVSVAAGNIFSTTGDIEFITTESKNDDDGDGFITVRIEALRAGVSGDVPAGTITVINTPIPGFLSATNVNPTESGQNKETDSEFRERYYRSLANAGDSTTPSIRAALLELPGVIDATVGENELDYEVDGAPPNCIIPFVHGGVDADIAAAIYRRKTGGIRSYGTTEVLVADELGELHRIGYSRPVAINIWVRLTITKNAEYTKYPTDGDIQVRTRIVEHIGGTDANGEKYNGRGLDADVIQYKLIAAIADIPGIDDVTVELSKDNVNFGQSNIVVDKTSIAQTTFDKVVIQ